MPAVNSQYQDRLFNFVFGRDENREWTLSLYNAINGTDYTDSSMIQINTIREVLYLGMHNDVSFLISDEMNLFEQQSTYNPNMPLRLLQYAGNLYEKYIKENGLNKYGRDLLPLPVPKLVTFYNGTNELEDEVILRLSDSFPERSKPDIDVTVRMLNINRGRNKALLENCEPLNEYAWLMQRIRDNRETMDIEDAVEQAINELPNESVLKPFLESHRAEVRGLLLTEYNEAEQMKLFERDGEKRGESRLAQLIGKLFSLGRTDDAQRAANDEAYRSSLYKEFGIL